MRNIVLYLLFLPILIIPNVVFSDEGPYMNVPPTNAFDKIHTNSGTVFAANFSMPLNIVGGPGVTVSANNSTHTLTITGTTTNGTTITAITCANNYQIHAVNSSGFFFCAPNNMTGTGQGTYNQTLANGVIINSGGFKINFINGTGSPILVKNAGNQVNVTISNTGSSGINSINSQTGPAYNINCQTGNITCTNSTNKIVIGFGINPVIINGSPQTVTKALTLDQLLLGGNANGGNFNFTNLNNVNATKFYQNTKQVIDTLNSGSGISITGSGNSRTITNTGILSAVTSINSQTGPGINIIRELGNTTITNSTNQIKVGLGINPVITGGAAQTITKTLTINSGILGGDLNVGSNALTNAGHKSTLPLTSGILCQTNQTGTCGADVNRGSYNITQANNVNKNTNGFKLNFINGSNAIVNVLDSKSSTQVNVTIGSDLTNTWQFVGRTTLGSASTSITLSGLTVYKYLWIVCYLQSDNSGTLVYPNLRFNSDSGAHYNYGRSYNGAAKGSATGVTIIELSNTAANENFTSNIYVDNIKTAKKIVKAITTTSLTNDEQTSGLWTNQVDNITEVDIVSTSGTSKYATGSEIIVFGKN